MKQGLAVVSRQRCPPRAGVGAQWRERAGGPADREINKFAPSSDGRVLLVLNRDDRETRTNLSVYKVPQTPPRVGCGRPQLHLGSVVPGPPRGAQPASAPDAVDGALALVPFDFSLW